MKQIYQLFGGIILVFFVYSIVVIAERVLFFQGHPISYQSRDINVTDEVAMRQLALACKEVRGANNVLEIQTFDNTEENATYARCGMWWPFSDSYRLVSK